MGFALQRASALAMSPSRTTDAFRHLLLLQRHPTPRTNIIRHLSVAGKDTESHLLPRLYVGPQQEIPLPLSQFLNPTPQNQQSSTQSQSKSPPSQQPVLREGSIVQLSPTQCHYVISVMRMVGPGRKKGRWSFQASDPCVRIFGGSTTTTINSDGQGEKGTEWVAQLSLLDDLGGEGDDANNNNNNKRKNSNRRRKNSNAGSATVVAQCLAPLLSDTSDHDDPSPQQQSTSTSVSLVPILCFAPPKKKDRFQWILEKGTELGMDAWLLLDTDRTESSSSRDYEQKGKSYVLEAAEQCERQTIPPLLTLLLDDEDEDKYANAIENVLMQNNDNLPPPSLSSLSSLLAMLDNGELRRGDGRSSHSDVSVLICRERSNLSTPILEALKQIHQGASVSDTGVVDNDYGSSTTQRQQLCMVLVGPEGGWSPDEEAAFDKLADEQPSVVWNTSLGSNVLRTDTAAVTAVAAFALHQDSLKVAS